MKRDWARIKYTYKTGETGFTNGLPRYIVEGQLVEMQKTGLYSYLEIVPYYGK